MKWYKKQLDKLKKEEPAMSATQFAPSKKKGQKKINNPVALRNKNRPKTDSIS